MKKRGYSRVEDSTFDLNLAPMLDIIVSVIPMLLMSVVFVRVMMIETPVPQVVEQAIAAANEQNKNEVSLTLSISKTDGFRFTVVDRGQKKEQAVVLKNGQLDYDALYKESITLKRNYPQVFKMELSPGSNVELTDIVKTLDKVRQIGKEEKKVTFTDVTTGKPIETDLMFPDVVFGNITGG